MKVDTEKLTTITNFAKKKGFSRQWMHKLIQAGQFDTIIIDGISFVKEKKVSK